MARRRVSDDPCGVARALSAVGDRWALLVVRELRFGPKRFADLSRGLPGMSQNVLSQRLRELDGSGVLRRRRLGPPTSASVYELTQRGRDLEPVLLALARWGSRQPLDATGELTKDALILALETTFDPQAAGDLTVTGELQLGDDRFRCEIRGHHFLVTRGTAEHPDFSLSTDAATLRALVFGGQPLTDALSRGDLRLEGDLERAERFVRCFPRPSPG